MNAEYMHCMKILQLCLFKVTICRTVRPGDAEDKMTQERDLGSVF